MKRHTRLHFCAGSHSRKDANKTAPLSLMMQLSTLGEETRRRAPAATVYICPGCIGGISVERERGIMKAIALAIQSRASELNGHPPSKPPKKRKNSG